MKRLTAVAALAVALGAPALAGMTTAAQARYGFRCSVEETVVINGPNGIPASTAHEPKTYVFVIDPDKMVYRERFLGSDGPEKPLTLDKQWLSLDHSKALSVTISGEFAGLYRGMWREENPKGCAAGLTLNHSSEGTCQEVTDIPDVSIPAKTLSDRVSEWVK